MRTLEHLGYVSKGHFLGGTRQKTSSSWMRDSVFHLLHDEEILKLKFRAFGDQEGFCKDSSIPTPFHHKDQLQEDKGIECRMTLTMNWSCLKRISSPPFIFYLLNVFFFRLSQTQDYLTGFAQTMELELWTVPFMSPVRIHVCGAVQAVIHSDPRLNSFQTSTGSCSASSEHRHLHVCDSLYCSQWMYPPI